MDLTTASHHDFESILVKEIFLEKSYKRPQLKYLNEKDICEKGTISIKNIINENNLLNEFNSINKNFQNFLENLEIFFYNSESIEDYGWGCAWRCIQTLLKTLINYLNSNLLFEYKFNKLLNTNINFDHLFLNYGERKGLETIFLNKNKIINTNSKTNDNKDFELLKILKDKEFAPFDNTNGWAEPFILDLIAYDLEILNGNLFLINGYPENAFAPKEVFKKIINFEEFLKILFDNFYNNQNPLPIVIDDSVLCLCIIGILQRDKIAFEDDLQNIIEINNQIEDEQKFFYELLICDPHVKLNIDGKSCIYTVILDHKGKLLKEKFLFNKTLYGTRFNFIEKNYMIYIPPKF